MEPLSTVVIFQSYEDMNLLQKWINVSTQIGRSTSSLSTGIIISILGKSFKVIKKLLFIHT